MFIVLESEDSVWSIDKVIGLSPEGPGGELLALLFKSSLVA